MGTDSSDRTAAIGITISHKIRKLKVEGMLMKHNSKHASVPTSFVCCCPQFLDLSIYFLNIIKKVTDDNEIISFVCLLNKGLNELRFKVSDCSFLLYSRKLLNFSGNMVCRYKVVISLNGPLGSLGNNIRGNNNPSCLTLNHFLMKPLLMTLTSVVSRR